MTRSETLFEACKEQWPNLAEYMTLNDMVTMEVGRDQLVHICHELRDLPAFAFEQCMDVVGVDYSDYGVSYWRTHDTTGSGFSRGVMAEEGEQIIPWNKPRFGVVYHLLSVSKNHRIRLKVYLHEDDLIVPSVMPLWPAANWHEREVYDLFGIVFEGHPDLRRLLTDYGFVGHPFRKDFPLIGEVELRYDAQSQRCVYEPVGIQPRVLVPKVIRRDNRYLHCETDEGDPNA